MRIPATALAAAIALAVAGCGGDGDDVTTEAKRPAEENANEKTSGNEGGPTPASGLDIDAKSSPEREIERVAESWAPLFAASADKWGCRYMTQPACEKVTCESVASGPIEDCNPAPGELRRSFKGAAVKDITVNDDRATAKFSNGEAVGLVLLRGHDAGDLWRIDEVRGDA